MTITVNPDLNLVVEQPLSRQPLAVVKLPRGSKVPIWVQFARDGAVIDPSEALTSGTLVVGLYYKITTFVAGDSFTNVGAASNATSVYFLCTATTPTAWTNSSTLQQCDSAGVLFSLIFSVKNDGEYDGAVLVLASGTDFTKFGTGTSTIFKSKCSFSTTEINTLLGVDASVANDESEVTLMGEVSWLGPDESKAFPFQIDLQNDSYKTNDVVTSTPGVQAMSLVTTSTEALLTGSRVITGSSTVTVTLAAGLVTLSVPSGLVVPSQTGNSGKYLTTNGAATSWGTDIDAALGNKLDTSAQAADVNPGGTDIALALAAKLPLSGGTMDENAIVNLFNGSKWQQSTPNKGVAGDAGFSVICSVGYEYKFANGYLFILSDSSSTVRKVLYAPATPTATDDTTLGFTTDTTWEMADGTQYHCTDVTEGAAVWEVVPAFDPAAPGPLGDTTPDVVNTTGLNVKDSGGNTTASIDGSDGSAAFGYYGGLTGLHIDQFGNITTNNSAEATLYNFTASNVVSAASGAIILGTDTGTAAWIHSDGGASFANGACTISWAGTIDTDSLYTDYVRIGGVNGQAGSLYLRDSSDTVTASIDGIDGSASFANGNATIDSNGAASFANGALVIDQWGNLTSHSNLNADYEVVIGTAGQAGTLYVKDSGGTTTASIDGAEGSASFAEGGLAIDQFGNITTNNSAEATLYNFTATNVVSAAAGAITLGTNTGTAAWINSDGTASFLSGAVTINSSNQIVAGSNGTIIDTDIKLTDPGAIRMGAYASWSNVIISHDGTASFASGAITLGTNSGTAAYIDDDGSASFASGNATIDTDGTLTLAGALIGGTQSLTTAGGAGAVNLTTLTTEVETTGTADALTLANGTVGQIKVITHTVGAFTSVLTPTTALGFSTITFLASLGQTCTLKYTTAGWVVLSVGGLTLPVVA